MLRNCQDCNKVFAHPTMKLCLSCSKKKNEDFVKVRDYITSNRAATIYKVSEETEVSTERIHEFIVEGRLKIKPADVTLLCAICHAEIESGRVCNKCSAKLKNEQMQVSESIERDKQTGKIHIYDQIRSRRNK